MDENRIIHNQGGFFKGPILLKTNLYKDSRGIFFESWNKNNFQHKTGLNVEFIQDNLSISDIGVLRGMHFQLKNRAQGKLVRCVKGNVFDVIVDLRKNSKTFKYWGGIEINSRNNYQLWIPPGFAHGFLSMEAGTIFEYKVTDYWSKDHEKTLLWNDEEINIIWPKIKKENKLSIKDMQGENINDLLSKNYLF